MAGVPRANSQDLGWTANSSNSYYFSSDSITEYWLFLNQNAGSLITDIQNAHDSHSHVSDVRAKHPVWAMRWFIGPVFHVAAFHY